jgi:RNA chaperone Hfq
MEDFLDENYVKQPDRVQEKFLYEVYSTKKLVTIYLLNGIALRSCQIMSYDKVVLIIKEKSPVKESPVMMVYKACISTITPI